MTPDLPTLFDVVDATWPAAAMVKAGPWLLREGRGGGKRVSAATAIGPWREDDLTAAETAMRLMGQSPLFMVRPEDSALDQTLAARGYALVDPVNIMICPIAALTNRKLPPTTAFTIWEPLAIMQELWEEGGIGEARLAVMERAAGPKTGLFGRLNDSPAGTGYCAMHKSVAMVHALEISGRYRGKGLGGWMMRAAGMWAERKGAGWMAILVTQANIPANRLYTSLGMEVVGQYHYRSLNDPEGDTA